MGYIADPISRHNFGHAIDLVLVDLDNNQLLDMGAVFDYFDELSHNTASKKDIGEKAYDNRILLASAMESCGFIPYEKEFWHFDYKEQEVDRPMDIPIDASLKGLGV